LIFFHFTQSFFFFFRGAVKVKAKCMIENNKTMKSGEKLGKEQQQSAIATTKERENRKRKAVDEIPISGFSKNFQIPFLYFFEEGKE